jgi:hypothetical protein
VPTGVGFFLTFFVSAVVHEYIICVALQFFYPVLLVMFLCFGVLETGPPRRHASGQHESNRPTSDCR